MGPEAGCMRFKRKKVKEDCEGLEGKPYFMSALNLKMFLTFTIVCKVASGPSQTLTLAYLPGLLLYERKGGENHVLNSFES